jgi:hypothetical protein
MCLVIQWQNFLVMILRLLFDTIAVVDINYIHVLWRFTGVISVKDVSTHTVMEILVHSFMLL